MIATDLRDLQQQLEALQSEARESHRLRQPAPASLGLALRAVTRDLEELISRIPCQTTSSSASDAESWAIVAAVMKPLIANGTLSVRDEGSRTIATFSDSRVFRSTAEIVRDVQSIYPDSNAAGVGRRIAALMKRRRFDAVRTKLILCNSQIRGFHFLPELFERYLKQQGFAESKRGEWVKARDR